MNLTSLPGVILDGKYRIERQLGKGGMGAVFLAVHLGTTRTVAVKVIVPHLSAQDEFLLRFQREAQAAGRLRHPNVVNVTDFGSTVVQSSHLAYLVMEFLDGQNLSDFLKKNPRPAADEILEIVDQVALGLEAAHETGIVHRDLKPDNIWLQPNHRGGFNVKVLDFGVAKLQSAAGLGSAAAAAQSSQGWTAGPAVPALGALAMVRSAVDVGAAETVAAAETIAASETVAIDAPVPDAPVPSPERQSLSISSATVLETTVGSVLGTPAYMAPEQCQGAEVDASADIYSLSVIAYQMFCGRLPFEVQTVSELLQKQIKELPTPPAERAPGISKRVSEVILGGLAKAPSARPPSAMAFAAQLRAASEGELKFLADGRGVASNHGNSLFPLLLACFLPQVPISAAMYLAARALSAEAIVPAGVLVVVFQVLIFAGLFFSSQMYKAGSAMMIEAAGAAGHFQEQWRPHVLKLIQRLGSFVTTHLRNTFDLRPDSFLSSQVWPMVWASEGLSGKAALSRAGLLVRTERAAAAAMAARQWGILLMATLFTPFFIAIPGSPGVYVEGLMGPVTAFTWLAILYPCFLSLMLFRFFGPGFFFLYLSTRRCLGETVEFGVPSARREKRTRQAAVVRPGTIAWLALPMLMALFLLYKGVTHVKSRFELFDAAWEGRKNTVLRALDSGLSVNSSDRGGHTALMYAVMKGDLELARELVARHANVNAQTSEGDTALSLALWERHSAEAEMLIASGANVQLANQQGRTPLFAAAMHGDAVMCKLLLAHGADPALRDERGKTALDYAKEEGYSAVVELLSKATPSSPSLQKKR